MRIPHPYPRTMGPAFLAGLLSLFLFACTPSPLRVGALFPLSGSDSDLGQTQLCATELALEKINAAGGVGGRKLVLVKGDTHSDPTTSSALATSMMKDPKVVAVLCGGTSREAMAAAEVAENEGKVLLCTVASAPELAATGKWVFRTCPTNAREAKVLADFAAYTLHASRVWVISSDAPEGRSLSSGFVSAFQADGRETVAVTLPSYGQETEAAIAGILQRAPAPHALLLALEGEALPATLRALRRAKVTAPVLAANRAASAELLARAGTAADTLLFAVPGWDPTSSEPRAVEFLLAFQARAGRAPDSTAAHTYDALALLVAALGNEGTSSADIRKGLLALRAVQGVSGTTTFEANGGVQKPYEMWVVHEGRPVPLRRVKEALLPALQERVDAARFGGR